MAHLYGAEIGFHHCNNAALQVLDEAHGIKDGQGSKFKRLMRVQSRRRLLLTGTPVQNNLLELFSILRFTMPHVFREKEEAYVAL